LFLGAVGAGLGSVEALPAIWAGALALLAAGAWCSGEARVPGATAIALAVWGYALWLVMTNAFANPGYTAAAPFHAAFLAAGFAIGRRLDGDTRIELMTGLAAGAVALSLWGLWQVAAGEASRAHAHFETPATLATVLNLALAPALVMLAWGQSRWLWGALGAVLAAGLAATLSRGGLLALACGLLVTLVIARRQGWRLEPRGAFAAGIALAAGWAIAALAPEFVRLLPAEPGSASAPLAHSMLGAEARESSVGRLELYALALGALEGRFLAGIGYLGFNAVLEAGRHAVPSYGADGVTYFAHNDYLQTFVELGVPGLAALAAMALLPVLILHRREQGERHRRLIPLAMLSALATMAAHAAVDFPFYVPLCLLLFGLALGALDRVLAPEGALQPRWQTPRARLTGIGIATVVAVLLVPPVAAEAAAGKANREWRAGQGESAAYWFEVARRIERRDWRYHWYAGQFWLAQAASGGKPEAARLAEASFAAGAAANPRDVNNLLGRIATHRRFAGLLEQPADAGTLRGWVERAAALAPLNPQVLAEKRNAPH
jgi:hypothetical protein